MSVFSSLFSPQLLVYLVLAVVLSQVFGVDFSQLLSGLTPAA